MSLPGVSGKDRRLMVVTQAEKFPIIYWLSRVQSSRVGSVTACEFLNPLACIIVTELIGVKIFAKLQLPTMTSSCTLLHFTTTHPGDLRVVEIWQIFPVSTVSRLGRMTKFHKLDISVQSSSHYSQIKTRQILANQPNWLQLFLVFFGSFFPLSSIKRQNSSWWDPEREQYQWMKERWEGK